MAKQDEWLDVADRAIWFVAKNKKFFTTDDVWDVIERVRPGLEPDNRRWMWMVVNSAIKDGLCTETGTSTPSRRPISKGRRVPVRRSLIYMTRERPVRPMRRLNLDTRGEPLIGNDNLRVQFG